MPSCRHSTRVYWKYFVHISSNSKPLCLSHNDMNQCFGVFFKFSGCFEVCLGGNSFSQRICKIQRNKKLY